MHSPSRLLRLAKSFTAALLAYSTSVAFAQTGSIHEPVRYVGEERVFQPAHDGQLRPAVGIESFQVMRANRTNPELADDFGWTYNHAPMICYWNGKFYIEYLSNPVGEHIAPGQTLLCTSADGRTWEKPQVIFPIYEIGQPDPPGTTAMMHQRMGFFIAPDQRLLACAFYGRAPHPYSKGGIGRVVREISKDGSFGPIHFLRFNEQSGFDESNTRYPFYTRSADKGFVAACEALLNNNLMREQWYDEEHLGDDAFAVEARKKKQAFNWFTRKDGKMVGLWKWSFAALSEDGGKTFSPPAKVPTLQMTGAKISGRRTADGRFALVYNPNLDDDHRWPLAIVTSDDGILFDHMLSLHGEVPPRRFNGKYKDFGPQYNRIVEEGNGQTPGSDLWVTYSMNKEDIWVSRVPVPVRHKVDEPVNDTFDELEIGGPVTNWNIYSPRWAPVKIADFPDAANKSLKLEDTDPYDYARAVRVFPESKSVTVQFHLNAAQTNSGRLEIEITDRYGYRPVRLICDATGTIQTFNGAEAVEFDAYSANRWHEIELKIDTASGTFDLSFDSKHVLNDAFLTEHVRSVERISFRTGPQREEPTLKTTTAGQPDFADPNPDAPERPAMFYIDNVRITPRRN